jgi:hypothetical protein
MRLRSLLQLHALAAASLWGISTAHADYKGGMSVEAVSDYSLQGSTNIDCTTEAQRFISEITSGPGAVNRVFYDNNVYDTDFPVGFICAHGSCDDRDSSSHTDNSRSSSNRAAWSAFALRIHGCVRSASKL